MANFWIYINGNVIGEIRGYEAAWDAYRKAVALCELVGAGCDIVDAETGEVIESFGYGLDDDDVSDDIDEMGLDPYEGCYTYDC